MLPILLNKRIFIIHIYIYIKIFLDEEHRGSFFTSPYVKITQRSSQHYGNA